MPLSTTPMILHLTCRSWAVDLLNSPLDTVPTRYTMSTPSTFVPKIAASAVERMGVESNKMTSYSFLASSIKAVRRSDSISSAGLGGMGPLVMRCRLSRPGVIITSSVLICPMMISVTVLTVSRQG